MSNRTTRAILIERHGPPEVLAEREIPIPMPARRDVHLRVSAVGVNFADLFMRAGLYDTVPPRPYSPGFEVAGEIVSVGSDVDEWNPGDTIIATNDSKNTGNMLMTQTTTIAMKNNPKFAMVVDHPNLIASPMENLGPAIEHLLLDMVVRGA